MLAKPNSPVSLESIPASNVALQSETTLINGNYFGRNSSRPLLIRLSDVEEKSTQWLWNNKIPLGMLSLIAGLGGIGKSFWTVYMTAIITNGWNWTDDKP